MNKNIIKKYEQIFNIVKLNNNEENKQRYIIIFNQLDLQLNNQLTKVIENLSFTGKTLRQEIKRIEAILNALRSRHTYRNNMVQDYISVIGYAPQELLEIKEFENEKKYIEYGTNLQDGYKVISELMLSGKKINELRLQAKKKGKKNKALLNQEADKLQEERDTKIERLKNNESVINDLYDYCINAPFNELNAYIQYILIKINPKSTLKLKIEDPIEEQTPEVIEETKVIEEPIEEKKIYKPAEEMPIILELGSVKPISLFENMDETMENFEDINLPSNGLIDNTEVINIDITNIEK